MLTAHRANLCRLLGGLVAVIALTGGCTMQADGQAKTAQDGHATAQPTPETPGHATTSPAPAEDALLLSASQRTSTCSYHPVRDYAWMEVAWEATEELEEFSFELINPQGVSLVGQPITIPPRNFGGRIDASGLTHWKGRSFLGDSTMTIWPARDSVANWYPVAEETGIVMMHLRFTAAHASVDGIRATYLTRAGEEGEASADGTHTWRFVENRNDCR